MKLWVTAVLALFLTGAGAVAETQSYFDRAYDFRALHTFDMKAQRRGAQDPLAENAAWAKAIRNEVMARLLESGYLRSVEQPHFVVAFYLGLRERPAAGYLDYDLPTTLAHEPLVWHSGWPPATDVWELPYTDSTLILDIIDTNDNRLVWRGFDTATIDVRAADRTFPKAIDKLLTRFRQDSARPRTSTRER